MNAISNMSKALQALALCIALVLALAFTLSPATPVEPGSVPPLWQFPLMDARRGYGALASIGLAVALLHAVWRTMVQPDDSAKATLTSAWHQWRLGAFALGMVLMASIMTVRNVKSSLQFLEHAVQDPASTRWLPLQGGYDTYLWVLGGVAVFALCSALVVMWTTIHAGQQVARLADATSRPALMPLHGLRWVATGGIASWALMWFQLAGISYQEASQPGGAAGWFTLPLYAGAGFGLLGLAWIVKPGRFTPTLSSSNAGGNP